LQDRAIFHTLAHISGNTDRMFNETVTTDVYLDVDVTFNFWHHPDPDSGSQDSGSGPDQPRKSSVLF